MLPGKFEVGSSPWRWFPHVPIALAVAVVAVLHLTAVLDQAIDLHQHLRTPGRMRQDLSGVDLQGILEISIGVFLLIMSVGLWLRSRVAWLLSVGTIALGIAALLLFEETPSVLWLAPRFVMLAVLLITFPAFNRSNIRVSTLTALSALLVFFAYVVLGTYHYGEDFSPPIERLGDAVYVAVVTISTVGFGDYTPNTPEARIFMVTTIVLSIIVVSTAVGTTLIPAAFDKIGQLTTGRRRKMTRRDHYIIVGYSTLASNTYRELAGRGLPVTVILRHEPNRNTLSATEADIEVGDGSDVETLRKAGAEHARAILALMDNDSENAFVVLAAKEMGVKAKTVAAVNDARLLTRIRHVHPDLIIAPQVLGGELLTSVLTGEPIDMKAVLKRILGET